MRSFRAIIAISALLLCCPTRAVNAASEPEVVTFTSEDLNLGGELFRPTGRGPFPAVLYNHGSAPGMLNSQASKLIGPLFASKGWVFFMPYRRGQGLSAKAGLYIGDQIAAARRHGGTLEASARMTKLLSTEHLQDQLAALRWLKSQGFVDSRRIAVAGNSFGGIEAVLGAATAPYCAALDASGGAETWATAPELQQLMKASVKAAKAPVFFFQAENDFDLEPSRTLYAEMKRAGKPAEMKIYPAYGRSNKDGHAFAYLGAVSWFPDAFEFLSKHCPE